MLHRTADRRQCASICHPGVPVHAWPREQPQHLGCPQSAVTLPMCWRCAQRVVCLFVGDSLKELFDCSSGVSKGMSDCFGWHSDQFLQL